MKLFAFRRGMKKWIFQKKNSKRSYIFKISDSESQISAARIFQLFRINRKIVLSFLQAAPAPAPRRQSYESHFSQPDWP